MHIIKSRPSIILLFLFLFSSNAAFAAEATDISMNLSPENPAPFENVNISLKSFAYNLDLTIITWIVNEKNIASGVGKKEISVKTGGHGSETFVQARILLPGGEKTKTTIIRPNEVVLLWEATDAYVPPFYKGKAMPSPDSDVTVVAIPEIKIGNKFASPKNMVFYWEKDFSNQQNNSGYNKNYFSYRNSYFDDFNNIGVSVNTIDERHSASNRIDIRTFSPELFFYEYDNDIGIIWEKILENGYQIKKNGARIVASPYFISPKQLINPLLTFNWLINNEPVDTGVLKKYILPVRGPEDEKVHGTANIKLEIENKFKLLQSVNKDIHISF